MTRVLVVWEDAKCEPLGVIAKRVVRATAPHADSAVPIVVRHSTQGNGAFERYVRTTWPQVRAKGVPLDPGLIDHVVFVVDGDHLHDLIPGVSKAPAKAAEVAAWHAAAERTWEAWLRARCDVAGPPATTVHGLVLRWSKESLVLAGYDQPAAAVHLGIEVGSEAVARDLATLCPTDPAEVDDGLFTDTFRQPRGCINLLRKLKQVRELPKNAREIDDVLGALARESLPTLRARVPDLARLAARIWALHHGEAPAR